MIFNANNDESYAKIGKIEREKRDHDLTKLTKVVPLLDATTLPTGQVKENHFR